MRTLLILHLALIGGIGLAWTGYGVYRCKTRWVIEGMFLTALVILNTIAFWAMIR